MKFIGLIHFFFLPFLAVAQCTTVNKPIIDELTFENQTEVLLKIANQTGATYNLEIQSETGAFVKQNLPIGSQGLLSFKADASVSNCFKLTATTTGCLPSEIVCTPKWQVISEPNKNVINLEPRNYDEVLVLKNGIQDKKYLTPNSIIKYEDYKIICREDITYRVVMKQNLTTITTQKWTVRALAGDCAVEPIEVPACFTPNEDGHNDSFVIMGKQRDFYSVMVFDRWDNKVFESASISSLWNGRLNNSGEILSEGTYTYSLKYLDSQANIVQRYGTVLLLK